MHLCRVLIETVTVLVTNPGLPYSFQVISMFWPLTSVTSTLCPAKSTTSPEERKNSSILPFSWNCWLWDNSLSSYHMIFHWWSTCWRSWCSGLKSPSCQRRYIWSDPALHWEWSSWPGLVCHSWRGTFYDPSQWNNCSPDEGSQHYWKGKKSSLILYYFLLLQMIISAK